MYNILYVSNLCSERLFDYILNNSSIKPWQAGQKYHKLLSEGLSLHDDICNLETLSRIPIVPESHKKYFWNIRHEVVGKIRFNYAPMINLPIFQSISLILSSFFMTLLWCRSKENNVIICDVLSFSVSLGAIIAAKLKGIKYIGIVTDLPNLVTSNRKSKKIKNIINSLMYKYNAYILMTEKMNKVANPNNKPYCIIEGLVDLQLKNNEQISKKDFPRNILYAGGLFEEFGVKLLIEAFMSLTQSDINLSIYGSGPMEKDMQRYCDMDKRIKYYGVVSNDEVVKAQRKATLLVNTRSTKEAFAEYSFPSKNIEYMVSGTPVATTILPGIPKEYFDYVYVFEDESLKGIVRTLNYILSLPVDELQEKGVSARSFVINEKNNSSQAHKVLQLISHL